MYYLSATWSISISNHVTRHNRHRLPSSRQGVSKLITVYLEIIATGNIANYWFTAISVLDKIAALDS